MSDIKPVFYVDATTLRCRTMDDISDESVLYYRRGDKVNDTDVALYSADVVEALQTENFDLKLKVEVYEAGIKLLENVGQENAAHAKRIAHLEYKIDELMLEWCPDEMTPEQLENYAKHQRKVSL